jgi:hypothetical protein
MLGLVAHSCNPICSEGRDQKNCSSKPAQANSQQILSQKNPSQKRADGVAQVLEDLPSECEALSSNLRTAKKKNRTKKTHETVCQAE